MLSNSIFNNLSKDQTFSEIRLQLSAPSNKNKSFVVVEGDDDISVLKPLLSDYCYLFKSHYGKSGVEELVKEFDDVRLLGIQDKDYSITPVNQRIFFYDKCNLEMMIISDIECFENILYKIIKKNTNYEKLLHESLYNIICLSALRKSNDDNDWGVSFERLPLNILLLNSTPVKFNELMKYTSLKNDNRKFTPEEYANILCNIKQIKNDLLNYTNGHDYFISLLDILQKRFTNKIIKNMGNHDLHLDFLIGYNYMYFYKTKLFQDLKDYGKSNNLKILNLWN